jgi:riboflavin kinase/FMN adenylyltransferase
VKIVETTSGLAELAKVEKDCVLTIGNFDGVHLGHRQILTAARQTAMKRKRQLVVMTFEPHPLAVLYPQKAPGILTPLALKKHLLAEFGIDCLFVSKTTSELLSLSAEDFVQRFLVENIQPNVVVEGESFNFGCGRGGSIQTLEKLGADKGFEVSKIVAKEVKLSTGRTVKVSSTIIRDLLADGKVADAAVALGRPYRLIGQVISGKGRGKQLGFPTINMKPLQQLIPDEGVYAGFVEIGDSFEHVCKAKDPPPAALSIGRAETLGSDNPLMIEAHILTEDVSGLHGKWLAMDFVKHLRGQKKFETEKELSDQIANDCQKAKEILDIKNTET